MAKVLKDDSTLKEQYININHEIERLQFRIRQLKSESKTNLVIFSTLCGVLLFVLSAFNPIGAIIGALIGWQLRWYKLSSVYTNRIKTLKKEISPISKGMEGELSVSKLLEDYVSDDYLLLNDITIPTRNGNGTQIDHILITNKILICLETKNITGNFYPHKKGWLWYPPNNSGRRNYVQKETVIKSPQKQSIYHANQLRSLLESRNIHVHVQPIVILTNRNAEWKGQYDQYCPVLSIDGLVPYIKQIDRLNYSLKEINKGLQDIILNTIRDY